MVLAHFESQNPGMFSTLGASTRSSHIAQEDMDSAVVDSKGQ